MQASDKYLETLLIYYEEEIMGEAYFYGLVNHFSEQDKLILLAQVERYAANSIVPLLNKYGLHPRSEFVLKILGESYVERHESFDWLELMIYASSLPWIS